MEGITLAVSISIIVFGILQIILFFKLWGMTNDVKRMREKIAEPIGENSVAWFIRKEILRGDQGRLNELLINNFVDELRTKLRYFGDLEDLIAQIKGVKTKYKRYYAQVNIPFPESLENLKTKEDIERVFKG